MTNTCPKVYTDPSYGDSANQVSQEFMSALPETKLQIDVDDFVITAPTYLSLAELNQELSKHNLELFFTSYESNYTLSKVLSENLDLNIAKSILGSKVQDHQLIHTKNGGKVIKNVSGYDLSKLYLGSYNSLAYIYEANLKVQSMARYFAEIKLDVSNFKELNLVHIINIINFDYPKLNSEVALDIDENVTSLSIRLKNAKKNILDIWLAACKSKLQELKLSYDIDKYEVTEGKVLLQNQANLTDIGNQSSSDEKENDSTKKQTNNQPNQNIPSHLGFGLARLSNLKPIFKLKLALDLSNNLNFRSELLTLVKQGFKISWFLDRSEIFLSRSNSSAQFNGNQETPGINAQNNFAITPKLTEADKKLIKELLAKFARKIHAQALPITIENQLYTRELNQPYINNCEQQLIKKLKQSFDPHDKLNPGILVC
jgi:hypothetical protein